jgi:hypothetical protein
VADTVMTNSYTPGSPLELDSTYYWRVDEVPGSNGPVWNFTTDAHHTVDDYDAYANSDAVKAVWKDYYSDPGGNNAGIVLLNTDAQFILDGNSMRFDYSNATAIKGTYYGSWAEASVGDLAQIGGAWNASGAEAIVLNFFGQSANSKLDTDRLYLKLEDGSANTGMVKYPDVNALAEEEWHEWNIELDDPNFASVSKSSISKVTLGFGGPGATGKAGAGGTGTVYFDDFEVWPPRCLPDVAYPFGDLTDDCTIDQHDVREMADDWLVTDYNTIGYKGTLRNYPGSGDPNYDNCWISSASDSNIIGTGALEFGGEHSFIGSQDNDSDDYVEIPPLNLNTNTMSVTMWVAIDGNQDDDGGLFFCNARTDGTGDGDGIDTTYSGFVMGQKGTANLLGYNWANESASWGWAPPIQPIPLNDWTFCALTIAPTEAKIYMMPMSTSVMQSATNTVKGHDPQTFGVPSRVGDHKLRNYMGVMDDFRLYDKTLSADEVLFLADLGPGNPTGTKTDPTDANLVVHYEFDQSTGLDVNDSAGAGVNWYPVPSKANYVDPEAQGQRSVNFRDFVVIGENWLEEKLWPLP